MALLDLTRIGPFACPVAGATSLASATVRTVSLANVMVCALVAALMSAPSMSPAAAQTGIKFSLDGRFEGPEALFLTPQDRSYFKSEGLDVTIDDAATPLEPITRVAGGSYDMGFADINALIRYRDQNPSAPIKAVFMVY